MTQMSPEPGLSSSSGDMPSESRLEDVLTSEHPYTLDPENDHSCPCFRLVTEDYIIRGHCWRTCKQCRFCGIHISSITKSVLEQKIVARRVAAAMTKLDWYGKWNVVVDNV